MKITLLENELIAKNIFGEKFKRFSEKKRGDIIFYGNSLAILYNDSMGIEYLSPKYKNIKELNIYLCGLYDMKRGKIKDIIKWNNRKLIN